MKYYQQLYLGERLRGKQDAIIQRLEKGAAQFQIYLLVLSKTAHNQMEIFDAAMLLQAYFPKDYLVVGLARGYDEALQVFCEISQDVYRVNGNLDFKTYFLERC